MALKVLLEQEKAFRTIAVLLVYLVSQVFTFIRMWWKGHFSSTETIFDF